MILLPDSQTDKLSVGKRVSNVVPEALPPIGKENAGKGRSSLQDLYFQTVRPGEYQRTKKRIDALLKQQGMSVSEIIETMGRMLGKEDIQVLDIHGRTKGTFSTFLKLSKYDNDISRIHDLIAIRVIVNDTDTCYRTLEAINRRYLPVADRIKDYIVSPKPNGYQSLHSTVKGAGTGMFEVQIRTAEMHAQAEIGSAAHWAYDLTKCSRRIMDSFPEQFSCNEGERQYPG